MVECEYRKKVIVFRINRVLIDTWWNVNGDAWYTTLPGSPVLIDTWWNVNATTNTIRPTEQMVLIDTWWNVNAEELEEKVGADAF